MQGGYSGGIMSSDYSKTRGLQKSYNQNWRISLRTIGFLSGKVS